MRIQSKTEAMTNESVEWMLNIIPRLSAGSIISKIHRITPFITKLNNPKVSRKKGSDRMERMGRTTVLRSPRTSPPMT